MRAPWVVVGLLLFAAAPLPASGAGGDAACSPGGPPVKATSGAGDPQLPSLVYASLKTGFRAVVLWETPMPEIGRLRYSLDGGPATTRSETVPRTTHIFVLDNLAIGRALCFTPLHQDGTAAASQHALVTRNAMNAHNGEAYVMNLLVLANEQSTVSQLEYAFDDFAGIIRDATDGHVRVGRMILVAGDYQNHNLGYFGCGFVVIVPTCTQWYDALFTNNAFPQGAASTYRDGIRDRNAAMWMNWYWQGGLVNLGDDVASVLAHEVGHYAFGMVDLYGGPDNCWNPANEISIMGANRAASEFDDEINRCPDEAYVSGYSPSYPRLRERFPLVPDRKGVIDPGPVGTGADYARHTFLVTPQVSEFITGIPPLPTIQQNDAGSGGDAGSFPVNAVPVEPDVLYDGTLLSPIDGSDMYLLAAPAGAAVEIAAYPRGVACFTIVDANGASLPGACTYDDVSARRTVTAPGGALYLKFTLGTSPSYRFGYGVDGPAPSLV